MLTAVFLLSCVSPLQNNKSADVSRIPAEDSSSNEPVSVLSSPIDIQQSLESAKDKSEIKFKIAQWVRYAIIFGAQTEKIVSSFDEKLKLGLMSGEAEKAKAELLEIDCQLMEVYHITHEINDNLLVIYQFILKQQDAELTNWFFERFAVAETDDTRAQIFARLNYVRLLKYYHEQNCSDSTCKAFVFSKKRFRFGFDPFSDTEAYKYRTKYNKEVALFYANPVGAQMSCLSRYPNLADAGPGSNHFGGGFPAGTFAVTYDDGPHESYTLDILRSWLGAGLAKPTFFWLAKHSQRIPQVVKAVASSGAEIACHSFTHPDLGNIAASQSFSTLNSTNVQHFFARGGRPNEREFARWRQGTLTTEFNFAVDTIENVLKASPASSQTKISKFRFPYGSGYKNPTLVGLLRNKNLVHVHWNIDSLDWQDRNPVSVYERVKAQMRLRGRGIILFHDIHPQSANATKMLIQYFKQNPGIKVQELSKLL